MRNNMQKVLKLSFLAMTLMVGFSLINALQVQALTIADATYSACPDKAPNNTGTCTVFINSITVNGFVDNDTSYTARTTPVPYGRLIPGQTITISWTDNSGTNVNNYIVRYGCGDSIGLDNDDHFISSPMWPKSTTWTVPSTNYKYCKIWVYAKGTPNQAYPQLGPTLGVSNTRAFEMQAPQTCAPYQTTPCTTSEGCTGTKTCNAYGTAWGSCIDNNPNDNCPIITQLLSVSCYTSPNPSQINQTVTFYSNVSGGSGSYTYSWSNYASGNNSYYQTTFGYAGTYTAYLTVSDSYGRSGSTTCSATVYGQSANTPTLSFWADDYTLSQGDSTYLRWTSNNANYCVASNGWSGNKSLSNYESTAPNSQTTYTLTCYGNGGQVTQSLTLYVTSPTTTLSFTKLGRNLSNGDRVYSKVIRVAQGDIIEFYLTVTAGSSSDLQNVVITDNLPSVFSYQSGTTKVNNITQADGITSTGLSLGTITRGTYKTVVFQALSNNPGTYFTYTNTAQVTASGINTISDNATITFSSVLGAATVQTGAEDSLIISLIISIGLAFLIWYYLKFNPQGKLVFARIENKIRDLHLEYLRKQIKR